MKQVIAFLKTKGLYIALGTGLVAFAGLMALYDYKGGKESAKNEQAIDLNQPVQSDDEAVEDESEDEPEGEQTNIAETAGQSIKTTEQQKNDKHNEVAENDKKSTNLAGASDATEEIYDPEVAAASGEVVMGMDEAVLSYDGSQALAWPLVGTIVLPYSMDQTIYFKTLNCYRCNPGIMISGSEDAPVYAIYDGKVLSVEESKEFGTTVTLDLGNGYHAIYGQLKNVSVKAGDCVDKAQPIGEVSVPTAYYTEEGTHLYFAMTKDDAPIDPTYYMQ